MNLSSTSLILLFCLPLGLTAGTLERTRALEYSPDGIETFSLETGSRNLEIRGAGNGMIVFELTARIRARKREQAEAIFRKLGVHEEREGGHLRLRCKDFGKKVSLDYRVFLPAGIAVEILSSSGNLEILDHRGRVDFQSGSGDLRIRSLDGPARLRSNSGDFSLASINGDLNARSHSGDIDVRGLFGDCEVECSSGEIRVSGLSGNLEAKTSSGDVEAKGIASPAHSFLVFTSSGDVDLALHPEASVFLQLRSGSGNLEVQAPMEVLELDRHRLKGYLASGDLPARVETSSGDIRIRLQEKKE